MMAGWEAGVGSAGTIVQTVGSCKNQGMDGSIAKRGAYVKLSRATGRGGAGKASIAPTPNWSGMFFAKSVSGTEGMAKFKSEVWLFQGITAWDDSCRINQKKRRTWSLAHPEASHDFQNRIQHAYASNIAAMTAGCMGAAGEPHACLR